MFNGKKVRELRKKLNLTQDELANIINLNKTSISYFERNERTPSIDTLIDLSYALNTTPYYLLDAEEIIKVSEDETIYETFFSKNDIIIMREIKKHEFFYDKLCENPKQTIEKIIKLLY